MAPTKQRVNHDLIARLYDDPGRDREADPNLVEFLRERMGEQRAFFRILKWAAAPEDNSPPTMKNLLILNSWGSIYFMECCGRLAHVVQQSPNLQTWRPVCHYFSGNVPRPDNRR